MPTPPRPTGRPSHPFPSVPLWLTKKPTGYQWNRCRRLFTACSEGRLAQLSIAFNAFRRYEGGGWLWLALAGGPTHPGWPAGRLAARPHDRGDVEPKCRRPSTALARPSASGAIPNGGRLRRTRGTPYTRKAADCDAAYTAGESRGAPRVGCRSPQGTGSALPWPAPPLPSQPRPSDRRSIEAGMRCARVRQTWRYSLST